ncbi:MAG: ATP-binding cassette domain-containing protein [Acidimicrobiia bacterium]|nr:ATP-binding cassette domain-containing protein [Acidimicrobiia bacterium]
MNEAMPVTVREVVMMGRYGRRGLLRPFRSDDREACRIALERLDIADLRDRHLDELSGGQRQRVFVAQGLVEDAQILLLDEPVTGLDLVSRDRIQQVIAEERDRGTTIVLTTHDLRDAWAADHVLLLAGRVVAGGPPGEVVTAERLSAAFGTEIVTVGPRSLLVDDAHHVTTAPRHVHFDRTGHHHGVPPSE